MTDLHDYRQKRPGGSDPRRGARPLLHLNSHNSNGTLREAVNLLTGSHRRMAFCLIGEIQWMADEYGLDNLGFLTLTHSDNLVDMKESSKRFNSLATGVLRDRYSASIVVTERQGRGAIHYHIVTALRQNIAEGFNWDEAREAIFQHKVGRYREAGKHWRAAAGAILREEWAFWRKTCPAYGFGRHELLPIRGTAECIAKYVGKYVAKHVDQRSVEDKGARTVRFIGFKARRFRPQFGWHNGHATMWRMKVGEFARINRCRDMSELKRKFGPRWCWKWAECIIHLPLPMPVSIS